jgi:hypothetical protein
MERRIVFAGLMPHAPILVPGVGGESLFQARATATAMSTVAEHALAAQPDTVVLVSPHSPRQRGAFGLWSTPRLRGSLGRLFGVQGKPFRVHRSYLPSALAMSKSMKSA